MVRNYIIFTFINLISQFLFRGENMKKGKKTSSQKRAGFDSKQIEHGMKYTLPEEENSKNKAWECARCGKCCKFIVIPVRDSVDMETEGYLLAHGIAYDGKKLIIPAICQYLKKGDLRGEKGEYYCSIHHEKFANCRLGGEKECREAQKAWALLHPTN